MADESGFGELTVVEFDGDSVVSDRNGDVVATFHGMSGDYDHPVWSAFILGLQAVDPGVSVFNESRARYHVCMGDRWIESEGRYENAAPVVSTLKP